MRHLSRLTLALALALLATPVLACDHATIEAKNTGSASDTATTASTTATSTASHAAMACCAGKSAKLATGSGCPHAAAKASAANCPHATLAATTAAAAPGGGETVRTAGKVVCERCELKRSDACRSVFQLTRGDASYALCAGGMTDQLLKLTRHGELEITVHGRLSKNEGGEQILCVDGFSAGTI